MKGNPLYMFKKLYADTAFFGFTFAIRCGIKFFGKDHILFALGILFDPEKGTGYIDRTLQYIDTMNLSGADKEVILYGNAEHLFHT